MKLNFFYLMFFLEFSLLLWDVKVSNKSSIIIYVNWFLIFKQFIYGILLGYYVYYINLDFNGYEDVIICIYLIDLIRIWVLIINLFKFILYQI